MPTTRKRKTDDYTYAIHTAKSLIGLVLAGLLGMWLLYVLVWDQNYVYCQSDLCGMVNWAHAQAELNRSAPAPLPPLVVPPPPAPQQVILQQQPAQQTIVVPAPQPRVEYIPQPCCGGARIGPIGQPYRIAGPPIYRQQPVYRDCNPTGGGFPQGNPCDPYGPQIRPHHRGGGIPLAAIIGMLMHHH